MRICLVYQGEYPPAERLEKIAQTLSAAGHDVFVLCNNYGRHSQSEERHGNLRVIRFRALFRNRTFNRILYFPLFLNPIWIFQLLRVIRRFRIEAIQVVDIPLALAALAVGRAFGLPVVMDMWENYPEALKGWAKLDWKVRVFKNPAVARAVELFVIPRVDQLFVVVDEQKERLIAEGVPPDRIRVLTNSPDVSMFTSGTASTRTPLDTDEDSYKLLYVGMITVERGLEDIIRALPQLRAELPKLRFYIAGTGTHEAYVKRLVESTGVDDLVRFTGWVPFDQIQFYVAQSDLCVIPHVRSKFIDTTIPNKLFQYMLMGKPVLVSDAKPLARVVRECGCGFVFESGRPDSAAAAIRTAYAARGDASIGEGGKDCVLRKYTWDKVSPALIDYYRRLEQERAECAPVSATTYVYPR